jgi:ribosome-associated protein
VAIKKKAGPARAKTSVETGLAAGAAATKDSKPKVKAKAKAEAKAEAVAKVKVPKPPSKRATATADKVAAARTASLQKVVIKALDDMKALEVKVLDVRGLTDVADTMVIASGTSDRHVRSVAKNVVEQTKAAGFRPHGVEGQQDSDWVLIDLHEMIVHVMLPRTREFYGLERLWDMTATKRAARA